MLKNVKNASLAQILPGTVKFHRHERALGPGRPYYDILVYPRVWIITETQLIVASSSINFVVSRNSAKKAFMGFVISFLSTVCLFAASLRLFLLERDTSFFGHSLSWDLHENGIMIIKKVLRYKFGVVLHPL